MRGGNMNMAVGGQRVCEGSSQERRGTGDDDDKGEGVKDG